MIALKQVNRKKKRDAEHGGSANEGDLENQMLSTLGSNNNNLLTK